MPPKPDIAVKSILFGAHGTLYRYSVPDFLTVLLVIKTFYDTQQHHGKLYLTPEHAHVENADADFERAYGKAIPRSLAISCSGAPAAIFSFDILLKLTETAGNHMVETDAPCVVIDLYNNTARLMDCYEWPQDDKYPFVPIAAEGS